MGRIFSSVKMHLTKDFVLFFSLASSAAALGAERRRSIPIGSCEQAKPDTGFECSKAYDGVIESGENGWGYQSRYPLPQWGIFLFKEVATVNRVALKALWADEKFKPKRFKIELKKNDEWIAVSDVSCENAEVVGSEVSMLEKSEEIDVAFKKETNVQGIRLTVTETFVGSAFVISEILVQYVPVGIKCRTVGGTQPYRQCVFPFVNPWTNKEHFACTTDFGLPPWCATRVNSDRAVTSYQFTGFCDETCEVDELDTCYTMWSQTAHENYANVKNKERRNCVFPFMKDGVWHNECMKNRDNIPYCATTVDKDGNMLDHGYCGPECPGSTVSSQCQAAYGWENGKGSRCVFPYKYEDKYYLTCADGKWPGKYNERTMCATAIDTSMKAVPGQWGYCGEEEKEEEPCDKNECITVGGAQVGQACRFPFRNPTTKELHFSCTTAALENDLSDDRTWASAPWCATDTTADDDMVDGKWGFCSKKCPKDKLNNCYVTSGTTMQKTNKCIFPFVFNGLKFKQCTYVKGYLSCPIKVDENGMAEEKDMKRCGPSKSCFNSTTINGNPITVGFNDVGSYTNSGSKELQINFIFETGIEDGTENNWNVEASITAGFEAFGAEMEASATVGGGGGSSSTTSSHQSHSLTYKCPARTKVVLSQQVLKSGVFESRTFKLILTETKIEESRNGEPNARELKIDELLEYIKSTPLN